MKDTWFHDKVIRKYAWATRKVNIPFAFLFSMLISYSQCHFFISLPSKHTTSMSYSFLSHLSQNYRLGSTNFTFSFLSYPYRFSNSGFHFLQSSSYPKLHTQHICCYYYFLLSVQNSYSYSDYHYLFFWIEIGARTTAKRRS